MTEKRSAIVACTSKTTGLAHKSLRHLGRGAVKRRFISRLFSALFMVAPANSAPACHNTEIVCPMTNACKSAKNWLIFFSKFSN